MAEMIPAILRLDIEPDDFDPADERCSWLGLRDLFDLVEKYRPILEDRAGASFNPSWFVRVDPDVERCWGHADHVIRTYPDVFEQIAAHGDSMGLHVHPLRWDAEKQEAFADHADFAWVEHCQRFSAEAFRAAFGRDCKFGSMGGYFLNDHAVGVWNDLGIEVDVTIEPGLAPVAKCISFGAHATAPSGDFVASPRIPYYPSRTNFNQPGTPGTDAYDTLMIPLTAFDYRTHLSGWHRRLAKSVLRWPRYHKPLNPTKPWPSPKVYWDLVAAAMRDLPVRTFVIAARTHTTDHEMYERFRVLFEYLPQHPISRRLHFIDPLQPQFRDAAATAVQT